MAIRGGPGEAGTVVDDIINGEPKTWGWYSPGEEFEDVGLDGEWATLVVWTAFLADPVLIQDAWAYYQQGNNDVADDPSTNTPPVNPMTRISFWKVVVRMA